MNLMFFFFVSCSLVPEMGFKQSLLGPSWLLLGHHDLLFLWMFATYFSNISTSLNTLLSSQHSILLCEILIIGSQLKWKIIKKKINSLVCISAPYIWRNYNNNTISSRYKKLFVLQTIYISDSSCLVFVFFVFFPPSFLTNFELTHQTLIS